MEFVQLDNTHKNTKVTVGGRTPPRLSMETILLCRFCLHRCPNSMLQIDIEIIKKIRSLCTLQIFENDGLPGHACQNCLKALDMALCFRKQCEESDKSLRKGSYPDFKPEVEYLKVEVEPNAYGESDIQYSAHLAVKFESAKPQERVHSSDDVETDPIDTIKGNESPKSHKIERCKSTDRMNYEATKVYRKAKWKVANKIIPGKRKTSKHTKSDNIEVDDRSSSKKVKKNSPGGIGPGLCPVCGKVFGEMAQLSRHVRYHTSMGTFSCSKCPKTFIRQSNLRSHERTHLNLRDCPCPVCGKLFSHKSAVRNHVASFHEKSTAIACELCNKTIANKPSLRRHMKIHTGEKDFICDVCEKGFGSKNNLLYHISSHTGERPFECKYCSARFTRPKSRMEHERLHTGEKPYVCPVCTRGFAQLSHMKSHYKYNHKDVTDDLQHSV